MVHTRRVIVPHRPRYATLRMPVSSRATHVGPLDVQPTPAGDRHTALAYAHALDSASSAAARQAASAAFLVWWREFASRHVRRAARRQREQSAAARALQSAAAAAAKVRDAALARQRQARLARSEAARAVIREAQQACKRAEGVYAQQRKRVRDMCHDADALCDRAARELAAAEQRQREWWQSPDRGRAWADAWRRHRVSVADAGMYTAGHASDVRIDVQDGQS